MSNEPAKEEMPMGGNPMKEPPQKMSIGVVLFGICVFIAFVFCIAGNPIGQMDSRTNSSCISIWGPKPKCTGTWFRHRDWLDKNGKVCEKTNSLLQAAQAFSVMSIIGGFLTTCVALLELFHFAELAVVAVIISAINMVATLVTWATMLALYYSSQCGTYRFREDYKIGKGLILYIVAWCLQMVGNGMIILDIYLGNAK